MWYRTHGNSRAMAGNGNPPYLRISTPSRSLSVSMNLHSLRRILCRTPTHRRFTAAETSGNANRKPNRRPSQAATTTTVHSQRESTRSPVCAVLGNRSTVERVRDQLWSLSRRWNPVDRNDGGCWTECSFEY